MKRFKRILFVIEGVSRIKTPLKRAASLARNNDAELTIMDVLETPPEETADLLKGMDASKLEDMLVAQRQAKLDKLTTFLKKDSTSVNSKVVVGIAFIEIIKEVLQGGYDLVIKPASGKGGSSPILFGSTDLNLMRGCPCAVWIHKPTTSKKYGRIMAAVDPDPADPAKNKLNTLIMDLGTSLAEWDESELHVVHSWVLYSEPVLKLLLGKGKIKQLARRTRKTHKRWLQDLLSKYGSFNGRGRVYLVQGQATEVIPKLTRKKRIELIVMGTVARTGLPEFLIGNTAEEVLNQVDCSVLAVKPEGFVSPVQLESAN